MNITLAITREEGSGGAQIAQEVARQLKWTFVDQYVVLLAAQRLGIPENELLEFDEKVKPQVEALGESIITTPQSPFSSLSEALVPANDKYGYPRVPGGAVKTKSENAVVTQNIPVAYQKLLQTTFREIAQKGKAVILGRGAPFALANRPDVLRVRIFAPFEFRVRRLMEVYRLSSTEAAIQIKQRDEERTEYIRHFYRVDWTAPEHYSLLINAADFTIPTATRTVIEAVKIASHQEREVKLPTTFELLKQDSFTLQEAARLTGISRDLLLQAVYRSELVTPLVNHRVNRISREALTDYLRHRAD